MLTTIRAGLPVASQSDQGCVKPGLACPRVCPSGQPDIPRLDGAGVWGDKDGGEEAGANTATADTVMTRCCPRPAPAPRLIRVTRAFDRLQDSDVTALQQAAGNRATVTAVQRHAVTVQRDGPVPWNVAATRKNRPTHGADVKAVLRSELPGLLGGLTEAQLAHWQRVVDYYAIDRHLKREITALDATSRYRAGPSTNPAPTTRGAQTPRRRQAEAAGGRDQADRRPTEPAGR